MGVTPAFSGLEAGRVVDLLTPRNLGSWPGCGRSDPTLQIQVHGLESISATRSNGQDLDNSLILIWSRYSSVFMCTPCTSLVYSHPLIDRLGGIFRIFRAFTLFDLLVKLKTRYIPAPRHRDFVHGQLSHGLSTGFRVLSSMRLGALTVGVVKGFQFKP